MKGWSLLGWTAGLALLGSTAIQAQGIAPTPGSFGYFNDALRYSQTSFGGSARVLGLGGAQTALGGDIGSLSTNPAGLGVYRRSEFSVSPSLLFANTESQFSANAGLDPNRPIPPSSGRNELDSKTQFNFHSIGVVFANPKDDIVPGSWRGGSWGIALTRTNNFHNRFSFDGVNNLEPDKQYSIADFYANRANETDSLEGELRRAFDVFSIDFNPDNNEFVRFPLPGPSGPFNPGDLRQRGTVTTSGAQYQFDVGYGGNFGDKFYIGGAVGIATIRFEETRVYRENNNSNMSSSYSLTLTDQYRASGSGINLRGGLIYRPIDAFRVGLNIQTPTWYAISEDFSDAIEVSYNGFITTFFEDGIPNNAELNTLREASNQGEFNYTLNTPFRTNAGLAYFFGKKGFVSADVEYVNFAAARVRSDNDNLSADNRSISSLYRPTLNYRLGGELRFDIFRVRLGGALYGDPFEDRVDDINRQQFFITGGAGIRLRDFYVDLGIVQSWRDSAFQPFTLPQGTNPQADVRNRLTNATLSIGTFF